MGSTPRGISASRGAAALGALSEDDRAPYQSQFELVQRIREEREPGWNAAHGYTLPDDPDNAAIRWGSAFEDSIVELASAKQGLGEIGNREKFYEYIPPAIIGQDGEQRGFSKILYPQITCHIDGRYWSDGKTTLHAHGPLHEGKTTNLWTHRELWGEPGTDRIPQNYQIQVQHQMLCTGAAEAIVSVLVFPRRVDKWEKEGLTVTKQGDTEAPDWILNGPTITTGYGFGTRPIVWAVHLAEMGLFHQYPVAANAEAQRMLVDAYRHFWDHYIIGDGIPDPANYEDVRRMFPAPVGTIVVSEQEAAWIAERKMITDQIGDTGMLAKRKQELKVLTLKSICARLSRDAVIDDESTEKVIFRDEKGEKLGSYDGKTLR